MTMDELGNLGDFVGGIAVVITLIYLAIQIRQNTKALRAQSWQEVVSGTRQAARMRGTPEMSRAFSRGLSEYPDMEPEDTARFSSVVTDEALNFQSIYALYEARQLAEPVYNAYLNWFASIIATPGGVAWWEIVGKPIFVADMVAAVDARLASGPLPDIRAMPGFTERVSA